MPIEACRGDTGGNRAPLAPPSRRSASSGSRRVEHRRRLRHHRPGSPTRTHPQFRIKLEAIGYGFLIPVFFVTSGIRFDLSALLDEPATLARVPIFLVTLLVVRGVPRSSTGRWSAPRGAIAAGLLQATSLPFIVAATEIGIALGVVTAATSAAFVAAGLVSALVFPTAAASLLRGEKKAPPAAA